MFIVATATFRLLYVLVILGHDRRKILHLGVTRHPIDDWLARQITDAFPWDTAPRYLQRDRDAATASGSVRAFGRWASTRSSRRHDHPGRIPMSSG
jgi:hypothetical protein